MAGALSLDDVKARLIAACQAIVDNQDRLTKADQAIGDGDHGVGMARGFRAAREALETKPAATVGELFKNAGMAVLMKSGGASGAVFGTFLTGMGKALPGSTLDASSYVEALRQALAAVQTRGGAKPGAKTMIDALVPAIAAAASAQEIEGALLLAGEGALAGVEATKGMIATTGKAKALGERSLGHPDPGAISLSLILGAFSPRSAAPARP
ncbi:dihydroxyacetone kinase subunit DhaL [soil metagenome]